MELLKVILKTMRCLNKIFKLFLKNTFMFDLVIMSASIENALFLYEFIDYIF